MRKKALQILAGLLLVGLAWAQDRGVITGIVLDENGAPVTKAKVHISRTDVLVIHQLIQFHETDAEGHFRIDHVPRGTYVVLVGKEDAGYPDTDGSFYSNDVAPIVLLAKETPTADVTLRVGPKAGVLELEPVTDSTTGSVIRLAAIKLKRADNPDFFIYTSASNRRFLVPPSTEVLVEVSAQGYKSWPATEKATIDGKIFLLPEQTQKLAVTLQPDPDEISSRKKSNTLVSADSAQAQTPQSQSPSDSATVSGTVTDAENRPLEGAKISIFPMDVGLSGPMPWARTDYQGRYRLSMPAYPGRTRLCAVKESAGYPDTQGLLFSSPTDAMPEISLVPGGVLEGIDIHLGPPDGVLEGSVVDSTTGIPVQGARLRLHRDSPESFYSTSLHPDGHFLLALPPVAIEITVTAPGYQRWIYEDRGHGRSGAVLSSGEHRNIKVELIPTPAKKD